MGIKDHLQVFPATGHPKRLAAVRQAKMRQLDGLHHAARFYLLMTPVRLSRITRKKDQGYKGLGGHRLLLLPVLEGEPQSG